MSATCEILVDDPEGRIQRLQMPCAQPAVIHYNGQNWCNDCADPNVLTLIGAFRGWYPFTQWKRDAIAALAPEEVTP